MAKTVGNIMLILGVPIAIYGGLLYFKGINLLPFLPSLAEPPNHLYVLCVGIGLLAVGFLARRFKLK